MRWKGVCKNGPSTAEIAAIRTSSLMVAYSEQKKPGKPIIPGFPGIDTKTALRFGRLFLYERLFLNMVPVAGT